VPFALDYCRAVGTRLVGHVRRQAVGYLALFVALGGTAFAATTLPEEHVTGTSSAGPTISAGDLKRNSVTARAIRRNAVRGSEVKESTLGAVPRAQNSSLLDGNTLAQIRAGIDATTLGGTPRSGFYDATEVDARLPRAAETRSIGEQNFSSGTPVDRISVQLDAPRDGFAFVLGSGNVHPNATIAAGICTFEVFVPEIPQVGRAGTLNAGDTTKQYVSVAQSWVVPVPAGPSTFTLRFAINANVSDNCNAVLTAASSSLNAIWIPSAG